MNYFFKLVFAGFFLFIFSFGDVSGQTAIFNTPDQQVDIDVVCKRLIDRYTNNQIDEASVKKYIGGMSQDGSWADIDYADTSRTKWKPLAHLERLKAMAVVYRTLGYKLYNVESLRDKIMLGLNYFYERKPVSLNWWYMDIGAPQVYMVSLILLKDKISRNDLLHYSAYLKDATTNVNHRGKNRSWVSEITIFKGCIENNFQLVSAGFLSMASTLAIESKQDGEGIKIDNSFHQHHAQLYSGGYGMSIMGDFANYMLLSYKTKFAEVFPVEKRKILTDVLLKGHQLLGYRNAIDFGAVGRNITRPNGTGNISEDVLSKMMIADKEKVESYEIWKNHLSGAPFAKEYSGNNYFWKSDIMTQHGTDYYLSAKIISKRTLGTESLNGENLKGYNLPLGATNIYTSGNEYRNIFPVWDWTRIPGTTAEMNQATTALNGYLYGSNNFGGGVSNGKEGAIAFEYNYNNIQAKKAYFFIDDIMFCLGTGINAIKSNPVVTSVNQCFVSGDVTINNGGKIGLFGVNKQSFTDLKWVYHDGVGYVFPVGGNITIQKMLQSGSWKSINKSESGDVISHNVFSLWFNHGDKPTNNSYQYMVVPGKSLVDFKKYTDRHEFKVIRNDSVIQAVRNVTQQACGIVFYQSGTVDMGDGLKITADRQVLVLMTKKPGGYALSVSDPVYNQQGVTLTLNKKLIGVNAKYINGNSVITVTFPTGDNIGKTVTTYYTFDDKN